MPQTVRVEGGEQDVPLQEVPQGTLFVITSKGRAGGIQVGDISVIVDVTDRKYVQKIGEDQRWNYWDRLCSEGVRVRPLQAGEKLVIT